MKRKKCIRLIAFSVLMIAWAAGGGLSVLNAQEPPAEQPGAVPTAAMLPILSSNDLATSAYITGYLEKCLQDRNAFNFVSKEKVDQAIAAGGYDMTKIFGLKKEEYKALAAKLGVDYILHGIIAVRKSIKFTGWRKDVDSTIKLYDGKSGKSIDSWRSMTDFSFTDAETEKDANKMGEATAASICEKMRKSGF
ncbi:MAG: hypothetical protein JW882_15835 [Deltaproteobacteria bacterium]|nr:hypothetical protein [Deltaproteobacteria bacterium]